MRPRWKKLEQLVLDLLQRYGVKGPPIPVEQLARSLGVRIRKYPFQTDEGEELSGILVRQEGKAIIGVNSAHHVHRRRFTIAHELGHFLLHEGNRVFVDRSYTVSLRSSLSGLGTDVEEIEANTFASMLLIPEPFLVQDLKGQPIDIDDKAAIERLARKYRVSPQAMAFRLANRLR